MSKYASLWYPKECYHINEDITRQRKAEYDRKQKALEKRCLEIDPEYYHRNLRERAAIRDKAEADLVW